MIMCAIAHMIIAAMNTTEDVAISNTRINFCEDVAISMKWTLDEIGGNSEKMIVPDTM